MLRAVALLGGLAASSASFVAWTSESGAVQPLAHGSREDLAALVGAASRVHVFQFSDVRGWARPARWGGA